MKVKMNEALATMEHRLACAVGFLERIDAVGIARVPDVDHHPEAVAVDPVDDLREITQVLAVFDREFQIRALQLIQHLNDGLFPLPVGAEVADENRSTKLHRYASRDKGFGDGALSLVFIF